MAAPEYPDLETALEEFDLSQQTFFNATTRLVRNRGQDDVRALHITPALHMLAFDKAVGAVLHDAELADNAKAVILANMYVGSEAERVSHLSRVLPFREFRVASVNRDVAADDIESDLVKGVDINELHTRLAKGFFRLLDLDIKRVADAMFDHPA